MNIEVSERVLFCTCYNYVILKKHSRIQHSLLDLRWSHHLCSLKKTITILTLAFFSLSTLVMPYANFDDVRSLQAVYNNCLKQDADMDFFEFIGEKLLVAGFDLDEADEKGTAHPQQPIHGANLVQIQTGALYRQTPQEISLEQPEVLSINIPLSNTVILLQNFQQGIFHPPAIA